ITRRSRPSSATSRAACCVNHGLRTIGSRYVMPAPFGSVRLARLMLPPFAPCACICPLERYTGRCGEIVREICDERAGRPCETGTGVFVAVPAVCHSTWNHVYSVVGG